MRQAQTMNQWILWMITYVTPLLIGCSISSDDRSVPEDLDRAVRDNISSSTWNSFDGHFKFERCLQYKISEMRQMVSVVNNPIDLIQYYPDWEESLDNCAAVYKVEQDKVKHLSERVASEMERVLGEETTSYLFMARLYQDQGPAGEWVDNWRNLAIIGIEGVRDVLRSLEEP